MCQRMMFLFKCTRERTNVVTAETVPTTQHYPSTKKYTKNPSLFFRFNGLTKNNTIYTSMTTDILLVL